MAKYTLVIDQGGHSTRAIVFNKKGVPIAYSSEPVHDPITNTEGHVEYDTDDIIESTQQLLQRLVPQLPSSKIAKIQSAAIITQRSSLIACDKTGNAITKMLSWQDTRNTSWLEKQNIDVEEYQQLTGLRVNPHMGASKIRWLLDHDKDVQQHAKDNNLLFMPWGAYFLQAVSQAYKQEKINFFTDPILASRTGLVEYGAQNWSEKLLALYAIPENFLPKIMPSSHHYGDMTLGETTIPITLLGGDQNFIPCAYGLNNIQKNIYVNMGTGVFIQAHGTINNSSDLLKTAVALETKTRKSHEMQGGGNHTYSTLEGTVNAAATILDWWQTQLTRPFSFTEIDQLINNVSQAPIFINTISGTGSPYWLSSQPATFLNDDEENYSDEQKTVAVIESILFACKVNIDIICQHNTFLKNIIISGGLARSNALCQRLSNLIQMTIIRHDDNEASARGAAFYLNRIEKHKPSSESTNFKPEKESIQIRASHKRFHLYQKAMERLTTQQKSSH